MRVINPAERAACRKLRACDLCGKQPHSGFGGHFEAHHSSIKRGMGGGSQIDVPENLACLHALPCHHDAEHSHDVNLRVREAVARRIGQPARVILGWLHAIVRADKAGPVPPRPWLLAGERRDAPSDPGGEKGDEVPPDVAGLGPEHRPARAEVGEVREF